MPYKVFVFGAGASAELGGPLVSRFLDKSERVLGRDDEELSAVLAARDHLRAAQANTYIDLDNIEELLTTLEMANFIGRRVGKWNASKLVVATKNVIARTVERSVELPHCLGYLVSDQGLDNTPYSELFRDLQGSACPFACITFNYDMALEVGLLNEGYLVQYFKDQPPALNTRKRTVPVLKMHGSTSWLECKCGEPQIIDPNALCVVNPYPSDKSHIPCSVNTSAHYESRLLNHHPKCGPPSGRFIVAPSWYKKPSSKFTLATWSWAAEILSKASEIHLIGYSWPDSDHFFKQLLAMGTWNGEYIKRFTVTRPISSDEDTDSVVNHYQRLLGPATQGRFEFCSNKFSDALVYFEY